MSIELDPSLKVSLNKQINSNNEVNQQTIEIVRDVVQRLNETRKDLNNRKEVGGAIIKNIINPGVGTANPSVTSLISISEQINLSPARINEKTILTSSVSKTIKNSIDGKVREDVVSSKLINQKRNRLNVRFFQRDKIIAKNYLSHHEFFKEDESYIYASEQLEFKDASILREVSVSRKAGDISVSQTTFREEREPKIRTWNYCTERLMSASDNDKNTALIAQRIAEVVINRCLVTLETHTTQNTRRQKDGVQLINSRINKCSITE